MKICPDKVKPKVSLRTKPYFQLGRRQQRRVRNRISISSRQIASLLQNANNTNYSISSSEPDLDDRLLSTNNETNLIYQIDHIDTHHLIDERRLSPSNEPSQSHDNPMPTILAKSTPCTNACDEKTNFQRNLASGFVSSGMNHVQCNRVLHILRTHQCFRFLPQTARKLLKTPRIAKAVQCVPPGEYLHLGLKDALVTLMNHSNDEDIPCEIKIDLHADGGRLNKKQSVWALLCRICNLNLRHIGVVGLYKGSKKPESSVQFLNPTIQEALQIKNEGGITYKGRKVIVTFRCLIADAPARAFLLNHKYHNAKKPCSKCKVEGSTFVSTNKRKTTRHTVFCGSFHEPRTTEEYNDRVDVEHHLPEPCALNQIFSSLVHDVPFEYMHLVLLGVTQKILCVWILGAYNKRVQMSRFNRNIAKRRFSDISKHIPQEYARKPADLLSFESFKATEFRQVLLITGIVVFRGLLPEHVYMNFILLHAAIRCLCYYSESEVHLCFTEIALQKFVEQVEKLYTKAFLSYNVHGVLHLVEDVRRSECDLDKLSAFAFENMMGIFVKLVRKPALPLQQIANRLVERSENPDYEVVQRNKEPRGSKEHFSEDVSPDFKQFQKLEVDDLTFRTRIPDNAVFINNHVHVIRNIILNNGSYFLKVSTFGNMRSFYDVGLTSMQVGVYIVSELHETVELLPIDSIQKKCFIEPLSEMYSPEEQCNSDSDSENTCESNELIAILM